MNKKNHHYKTFYTVNAAKQYLSDSDEELSLFAADHINNKGVLVKAYVVSTYAGIYALSKKFNTSFYEWIDGTVPVKFHVDIDCKEEQFDGRTQTEALDYYVKQTVAYVNEFILPVAGVKKGKHIVLKSENVEGKASAHIIYTNVAFENIYHIKNILNEHPTELTQNGIFDPAIYRQGCFRNYLSCKLNKNNKLILYKSVGYDLPDDDFDLFLDTLVTNVDSDTKLVRYEWAKKATQKSTSRSRSSSSNVELEESDENHETLSIEQLKRYVDLLGVGTADNYEKWMKVGLIIHKYNNTKKGFELFKTFSKLSEKYDENYCKMKWNSYANKQYERITVGTLKSYARADNKEEYDKLECEKEVPHYESLNINQQYIMSKTKALPKLKKHFDEWNRGVNKVLSIRSAYNTGKTQTLKHLISECEPTRILFVTCRQSLAYNLQGSFAEEGVENYLDGEYRADRLICSLDSLFKLVKRDHFKQKWVVPHYDMVVLDEVESILAHFESNIIANKISTFVTFDAILKKCEKIVSLDGTLATDHMIICVRSTKTKITL